MIRKHVPASFDSTKTALSANSAPHNTLTVLTAPWRQAVLLARKLSFTTKISKHVIAQMRRKLRKMVNARTRAD
jgi:hypothetical protein